MLDMIDLTHGNFAQDDLGELWLDFTSVCSEQAAIQFNDAYNLISISFPDNNMGIDVTTILIDEGTETPDKVMHVRKMLINNLVDCLQIMGIIVDLDFVDVNSLKDLTHILNTIYMVDGIEDVLGLVDILEDEEYDTKGRFIEVIRKMDPSYDCEQFPYLIKGVAPNVIKGILVGLNVLSTDDKEYLEPSLKKRMINNKQFLTETLAEHHIVNGGAPGLELENLTMLFVNELGKMLVENPVSYLNDLLGLMLIANLTDEQIETQFMAAVSQFSEDIQLVYKAQQLLQQVKLHE